jgi:hypothetical protein
MKDKVTTDVATAGKREYRAWKSRVAYSEEEKIKIKMQNPKSHGTRNI